MKKKILSIVLLMFGMLGTGVAAYFSTYATDVPNHIAFIMGGTCMAAVPAYGGRARAIYEMLQNRYSKLNFNSNVIIEPSYLRIQQLTTTNNVYGFDVINGTTAFNPVEQRLQKNDVFIVTYMAMYIAQYPAVANVPSSWYAQLNNYPNNTEFGGLTTPKALNVVYQGYFSIQVGRVVYFNKFPTQHMQRVGITQQSSATNWSDRSLTDGAVSNEPVIFLSGAAQNTINLTIPITGSTITDSGTTTATHIIFLPYGYLAAGCATYESDYQASMGAN